MGAIYVDQIYKKLKKSTLEIHVKRDCEDAARESGRSFSGDWGEKINEGVSYPAKCFTSRQLAEKWMVENSDKHGPLLAVKIITQGGDPESNETEWYWYVGGNCAS